MMEAVRPAFLWAGALFALFPLLLHFLVPRTRRRKVLPTARFLTPSARTRIRLHRRPTDPLLLALRMAFAAILGAAFAGLHWHGAGGTGTTTLLVVDGGERQGPGWPAVREATLEGWSPGTRVAVVEGVDGDGAPRVRAGVPGDEGSLMAFLDASGGDGGPAPLPLLLRGLRQEAAALTAADSVRARLVSGARVGSWTPGLTRVRGDLWPAAIEWVAPEFPAPGVPWVELDVPPDEEVGFGAALAAAGWRVASGTGAGGAGDPEAEAPGTRTGTGIHLRVGPASLPGAPASGVDPLWRLPEGASAEVGEGDGSDREARIAQGETEVVLPDGRRFPAWGPAVPGTPAARAMVPLFRGGGRPAAAAVQDGGPAGGNTPSCRVLVPTAPDAPGLVEAVGSALPDLLDGLLRWGCPLADPAPLALAVDLRELLEAPGGVPPGPGDEATPDRVAVRDIRGPADGVPLTPILLGLALLLLGGEGLVIRRRRQKGAAGSDGDGKTKMTEEGR